MSNNRNQKAAIIALITVVVLSLAAVFLIIHLLKDVDYSSIKMPVLPWSKSTAVPKPQSTFDLTPPSVPVPSQTPSSKPGIFSVPAPLPRSTPDPLSDFDTIFFGTYKDHPIEWIILGRQDDRLLLLCKRALETLPYDNAISSWWLRSPGLYPNCAEYVYRTGAFFSGMANRMYVDVRPAMWIEWLVGS